jgi:hypothetical protein
MYYSIPEVRKARLLMRDVNYADIMSPKQADKTAGRIQSGSQEEPTNQKKAETIGKVTRKTCIYFECDPILCLWLEMIPWFD